MLVDLRSDTVTRPTPEMRRAMAQAEVGDDEYGEDPTVRELEELFAGVTGKEAALFVPSGTMGNQVALRTLTRPGDAVVAGRRQHVVLYEAGAGPINAGVSLLVVDDTAGALDLEAVQLVIDSAAHHQPKVAMVSVEDSHMASGGRVWPDGDIGRLGALAGANRLPVHLDGARLWNAAVASGVSMRDRARSATTVMCCLSKGLAAPVGSLLAGPSALMDEAKLHRKRFGGAMRQSGILAAAGLVAVRRGVERLADDHRRAAELADAVGERWPDIGFDPAAVDTNILVFSPPDAAGLLDFLASEGILAGTVAPGVVRLVTHCDVDDAGVSRAGAVLRKAP